MFCKKLIAVAVVTTSAALAACGGSDSATTATSDADAEIIDTARQAVIDADKVQYDFSERKPLVDKTDPDLIRIAFIMKDKNKIGGDPVVFITKSDGSVSSIQYTR